MPKVLIIDDERDMAERCIRLLRPLQVDAESMTDAKMALDVLRKKDYDVILTDLRMPQCSGMEIVKAVKESKKQARVIMITGFGSIDIAVEAMKNGAFDFIAKPFSGDQLRLCVQKALREMALCKENESLKRQLRAIPNQNIIGDSPSIQAVLSRVRKIANTDLSVLILGESGTGKEIFARTIHSCSPRAARAFVPIDCAALPEHLMESELFGYEKGAFTGAAQAKPGLLELADGGTLFLDELGELSLALQAKLLRVLQERTFRRVGGKNWIDVDIRLVAATNVNLLKAVEEKRFREDLFYRLNVVTLQLPPLRSRQEDISLLAYEFMRQANARLGRSVQSISPETLKMLELHSWPGNIRQLKNAVERAVAFCEGGTLLPLDFSSEIREGGETPDAGAISAGRGAWEMVDLDGAYHEVKERWLKYWQTFYFQRLLEKTKGNISKAAEIAGVDRRTIHRWLQEYGENPPVS